MRIPSMPPRDPERIVPVSSDVPVRFDSLRHPRTSTRLAYLRARITGRLAPAGHGGATFKPVARKPEGPG